jgi:hypothetical protein
LIAGSTERTTRLDAFFEECGFETVWFATPDSLAWPTDESSIVDRISDDGIVADAGIDADADEAQVD